MYTHTHIYIYRKNQNCRIYKTILEKMGIILETIDVDIMICKRNIGENRARMCLLLIYASYQLLLIIFLNKIQRIRFQGKQKTNEKIGHARVLNRRKLKCRQNFHHLLEIILDS
jgi:hypothetical protein